jgi:hypothetical protein
VSDILAPSGADEKRDSDLVRHRFLVADQHGHSIGIASNDRNTKDNDKASVAARSDASDSIHVDRRIRRQREW